MENIAIWAVTALNLLASGFIWLRSSEMLGISHRIRSLESFVKAEVERLEGEIPNAEIRLAGQLLEATELVETVRSHTRKAAGKKGGQGGGKAAEQQLSYLDESLPREVRHALMKEQMGV